MQLARLRQQLGNLAAQSTHTETLSGLASQKGGALTCFHVLPTSSNISLTRSCNLATAAQIGSRIRRTSHPSNLIEGLSIVRTASTWTYEDL